MALAAGKLLLSSALVLVALNLHGCESIMFAVPAKFYLEDLCDKKIRDLAGNEKELEKVFHAVECDQLDQDMLKEFRVDDCPTLLQHTLVEFESWWCDQDIYLASKYNYQGIWAQITFYCGEVHYLWTERRAADVDGCKPALEAAVKEWVPAPPEDMDAESKELQVRHLAAVMGCKSVTEKMEVPHEDVAITCEDFTTEEELGAFGYDSAACEKKEVEEARRMRAAGCMMSVAMGLDEEGIEFSKASFQDIKGQVDSFKQKNDEFMAQGKFDISPRGARELLRSVAARRWSPGGAAAVSAAAALAVAALGAVAWRLHRGRGSSSSSSSSSSCSFVAAAAGEEATSDGVEQLIAS